MISNREGREWLLQKLYDRGFKYIFHTGGLGGYLATKEPPRIEKGRTYIGGNFESINLLGDLLPNFNEPNYLDIGKYLGITDWGAVAIDTPVYVKLHNNSVWCKYHFAKYEDGKVYVWALGTTSWSKSNAHVAYIPVVDARLGENEEP